MKKIAELAGLKLNWGTRPFTLEYELRANDELAATLCFKKLFGTLAIAESADGSWSFKRMGLFKPRVTIQANGSDEDIAIFRNNTWSEGGTLEFPDGRKYLVATNFWQSQYEFRTETGQPLLKFKSDGFVNLSAQVELLPEASGLPDLPWMVMFGWYLVVMMDMDSAATASTLVAATAVI